MFEMVLPTAMGARYYLIESKSRAAVMYEPASGIPLVN
jgi:hypothetical protein